MAALPMVLINHADIKSAGGVALHVGTQPFLSHAHQEDGNGIALSSVI